MQPKIYIALPVMDEYLYIRKLLDCVRKQTYRNFHLFICVNQPEIYHDAPAYAAVVEGNRKTLELLGTVNDIPLTVIDRSLRGKGWDDKNYGVGWARKVLFDEILEIAADIDIVVSMDADTKFNEQYFEKIVEKFRDFPAAVALSNPYYHPLTTDRELNRLMFRYEIYMRYYALNLWRIRSPYCFTALGSAISFSVEAYRKISGVAPKFSGEDFYLLQKLRKSGRIVHYNEESVFPATRYSNRVFFGTGPALIKGRTGDWTSYPFYGSELFDSISQLYEQFQILFVQNIDTVANEFLKEAFGKEPYEIWDELRQNNPYQTRFIHACHLKFDGLRILQFLRFFFYRNPDREMHPDFMYNYLQNYHSEHETDYESFRNLSFQKTSLKILGELRDVLFQIENDYRKHDQEESKAMPPQKNPSRWKYLGS